MTLPVYLWLTPADASWPVDLLLEFIYQVKELAVFLSLIQSQTQKQMGTGGNTRPFYFVLTAHNFLFSIIKTKQNSSNYIYHFPHLLPFLETTQLQQEKINSTTVTPVRFFFKQKNQTLCTTSGEQTKPKIRSIKAYSNEICSPSGKKGSS